MAVLNDDFETILKLTALAAAEYGVNLTNIEHPPPTHSILPNSVIGHNVNNDLLTTTTIIGTSERILL